MNAPGIPHSSAAKKTANTTRNGEIERALPGQARLEVAADEELDETDAGKDEGCRLPRLKLDDGEKRRQHRRYERPDEWDEVQHERQDTPGHRQLDPSAQHSSPTISPVATLAIVRMTA